MAIAKKQLGALEDLVFSAEAPLIFQQTRSGVVLNLTKVCAETIPYAGKPGSENFKSIKDAINELGGDMTKFVYDTNYDGKVDFAEQADVALIAEDVGILDLVRFNLSANLVAQEGEITWNAVEKTFDIGMGNGVIGQLTQELQYQVRNTTASTITDMTPLMETGTTGNSGKIEVAPWDGLSAELYLGLATENISPGQDGRVTYFGKVRGVDTSTWNDFDILYPTTSGGLTNIKPTTGVCIATAVVIHSHTNGTLFVRANNLDLNKYVSRKVSTDNQVVRFDGTTGEVQGSGVTIDDNGNTTIRGANSSSPTITIGNISGGAVGSILKLDGWTGSALASAEVVGYGIAGGALGFKVGGIEHMRIDASGNVGIGTGSPDRLLHLAGQDTAIIRLENTDTSLVADQLVGSIEFEKQDPSGAGVGLFGNISLKSADSVGSASYMTFNTSSSTGNNLERMRIDASGNCGWGVIPSAWGSSTKAIQFGQYGSVNNYGALTNSFSFNSYKNSSNVDTAINTNVAFDYMQHYTLGHLWKIAPSTTAGNPITWTTAMTLDTSSKLSVTGGVSVGNTAVASATTLDWYEEATATLTATGMTTSPTGVARFTRIGDTVTAEIPTISGTSNATTFTLTGVPTNFRPGVDRNILVRSQDNSGAIVFSNATINSSGVITIYKDAGTTAFTSSGTKSIQKEQAHYHI